MTPKLDVNQVIKDLSKTGVIETTAIAANKMNGTTEGLVYTLTVNDEPKYVLTWYNPL
ncbi:MAG: hypothetical protein K0Q73_5329 [Paenibacillus sp.]|nr:hypothetical protein [Paenibacillus sp.]